MKSKKARFILFVSFWCMLISTASADEYQTDELVKKQCQIILSGGHFNPPSTIPITEEMYDKREITINTNHFQQKNPAFVTDFSLRLYRESDPKKQTTFYRVGVVMKGISPQEAESCGLRSYSTQLPKVFTHMFGPKRTAIVLDHVDFTDEKTSEVKKMKINFPGVSPENNEFQMQIKCAK